jgi:hypothetical protein
MSRIVMGHNSAHNAWTYCRSDERGRCTRARAEITNGERLEIGAILEPVCRSDDARSESFDIEPVLSGPNVDVFFIPSEQVEEDVHYECKPSATSSSRRIAPIATTDRR